MNGECPICERKRGSLVENEFFPFCSAQCRLIDLGRWLGEEYVIPNERPQIHDEVTEVE